MGELVEGRSLEAEIVECCQTIYRATEADVALSQWTRLRGLLAAKTEVENRLYLLETGQTSSKNH